MWGYSETEDIRKIDSYFTKPTARSAKYVPTTSPVTILGRGVKGSFVVSVRLRAEPQRTFACKLVGLSDRVSDARLYAQKDYVRQIA